MRKDLLQGLKIGLASGFRLIDRFMRKEARKGFLFFLFYTLALVTPSRAAWARAQNESAAASSVAPYNFEIRSGNEYTSLLSDRQIPIIGKVAYSIDARSAYSGYLHKLDISNPLQPVLLQYNDLNLGTPFGFLHELRAVGGQIYSVAPVEVNEEKQWWHDILYLVTPPAQGNNTIIPFSLDEWTPRQNRVLESCEDHAFIFYSQAMELLTFDPTYADPRLRLCWKATIDLGTGGDIRHIRSAGKQLLICNGYKGVLLYDITSQSQPLLRSTIPPPVDEVYDIAVKDNRLYLTDQFAPGTRDNFYIFDISDLIHPRKLGSCKLPDGYARDLDLGGGMAYVTTIVNNHFYAVDVSDPAAPQVCASYDYSLNLGDYYYAHYYKGYIFGSDDKILRYKPQGVVGVSNLNRSNYNVDYYRPGNLLYADQEEEFAAPALAELKEQTLIQTRNADQDSTASGFVSFDIDQPAKVYVAYDAHASRLPQWLAGWAKTGWTLGTTQAAAPRRTVYVRSFPAGRVRLGGNRDQDMAGGLMMYSVFLVPGKTAVKSWGEYQ